MLKSTVYNIENHPVSEIELPESVFDYPLNEHLIWEAVKNYRANQRSGNHATKNRAKVAGSGKKLWRQKGTGRARMGSARSPLWRKGGTVFGPQPRDYSYSMPKKARRNALKSVLSDKYRNQMICVLDQIQLESHKTRETQNLLSRFEASGQTVLIVDSHNNEQLMLSARNLPNVKAIDYTEINIYDSLKYHRIMMTVDAVNSLLEVLK